MSRYILAAFIFVAIGLAVWVASSRDTLMLTAARAAELGQSMRLAIARLTGVAEELERLRQENLAFKNSPAPIRQLADPSALVPVELVFVDQLQPLPTRLILRTRSSLAAGDLLVSGDGSTLVGVIERSERGFASARTLMASSFELAVLGVESGATGALAGSNLSGFFLQVRFAPEGNDFKEGERVVTAGVGAPRGLHVGVVTSHPATLEGAFRVRLLHPPFSPTLSEPLFVLRRSSFPGL